jgi:hypothetical protein
MLQEREPKRRSHAKRAEEKKSPSIGLSGEAFQQYTVCLQQLRAGTFSPLTSTPWQGGTDI